jgi:uncharacterized protein (TIGR03435 family)
MRRIFSAVVAALFVTTLTIADVGTHSTSAAFDAASVKPNKSGDPRTSVGLQAGGRFTATNVPLRALIARAYGAPGTLVRAFSGLSDSQQLGGPDWINAERFDIVATAGTNATPERLRAMLRTLLADRFKLAVHTEKKTVSALVLVMASSDKKLGRRLRSATVDCGRAAPSPRSAISRSLGQTDLSSSPNG